jgi:hypothetical protein
MIAVLLLACGTGPARTAELSIRDAWIPAPPPGARHAAAYLTVDNRGSRARFLSGATSPAATAIAVHLTEIREGVARMRPAGLVRVEPGGKLVFAPGSLHLMLFLGETTLQAGSTVRLELSFDGGETIDIDAAVRTAGDAGVHPR